MDSTGIPLLDSDEYGIVLVTEGGYAVVVWSYSLDSGGRDALLDEIYVCERGQGQGTDLVRAAFAEIEHRGLRQIFLETEPENERARSFYRRLGYEQEKSIWMVADLGSPS